MEQRLLAFLCILLLAWVSALGFSLPNETGIKANSVYLGTVDGKSFFVQKTPPMTWFEAKGNCTESGMDLASVTSIAQLTLLNQAYNNVTFNEHFWTSGRDALAPTQMVWDKSGNTLNTTVVTEFISYEMLTCLSYCPDSNASHHFHAYLCTTRYGAICEINHEEQCR